MSEAAERALRVAEHTVHEYAPGDERPLLDHAALVGVYGAAVAGLSFVVKRRVRRLPAARRQRHQTVAPAGRLFRQRHDLPKRQTGATSDALGIVVLDLDPPGRHLDA